MNKARAFLLAVFCVPLWAQQDRGTIAGMAADATGGAMPGVSVTAVQAATGVERRVPSNGSGWFALVNLPAGEYRVSFEARGFGRLERRGVLVEAGGTARVDVTLHPGERTESVVVTAAAPPLQTDSGGAGTLLDGARVLELPLSFAGGRSAEAFAYKLAAGVEGDNWESRVNGSPSFSKETLLDGASVTTYLAGHFGESGVSLEALEEFRVETSGLAAEYGRTSGGLFNFVMKSGTSRYHGSAMGQFRNESLDANSFINNAYGRKRQNDRRTNYALSAGGPVALPGRSAGSRRTFFHAAYEKYHEANRGLGSPNRTVPLAEWWNGDMSRYLAGQTLGQDALGRTVARGAIYDPATTRTVNGRTLRDPFFGNQIPASRISRVARRLGEIMQRDYAPLVAQADGQPAMVNNSFFPVANTTRFDQRQGSVKLDRDVAGAQRLSGSLAYANRPRILIDQGGVWNDSLADGGPLSRARYQSVESWMGRAALDSTLRPNLLNHLLAAFNRQVNPARSAHAEVDGVGLLGIGGLAAGGAFPEIVLQGGDRVSIPTLGYTANGVLAATSYEVADTLSWWRGGHLWKFGVSLRRNQLNTRDLGGPARFEFGAGLTGLPGFNQTGHPFASMLLGEVSSASATVDTPMGSRFRSAAVFAQDDWRVHRRLTLNLGLRWEYQPVQREAHARLGDFCTASIDPETGLAGAMEYGGGFTRNRRNGFGPRAGLAWQWKRRLVWRAAYGILHQARVPNDWSGAPYGQKMGYTSQNVVADPGNGRAAFQWDQGYPGVVKRARPDPSLANSVWGPVHWDPEGGKVPYVQQWNVNLQASLPWGTTGEAGYLGNQGTGLYANSLKNLNQIPAAALALGDELGTWVDSAAGLPAAARALGARYPFGERGDWIPVQQTLQPFPQIPYWSTLFAYNAPLGFSTWHALQLSAARRPTAGLTWMANYTFSKTISNLDSSFNTWSNYGRPLDYRNLAVEKSVSVYDRAHVAKVAARWEVPLGRGMRGWRRAALAGWTLHAIAQYGSGYPLGFGATAVPNANFAVNRAVVLNAGGESLYAGFDASRFDVSTLSTPGTAANRYVRTERVKDAGRYELGNASATTPQIRGFGFANEDLGVQKRLRAGEKARVVLRAEFLNVLNRHRFSAIDTSAPSALFGQVTGLDAGFFRQTQLGARLEF